MTAARPLARATARLRIADKAFRLNGVALIAYLSSVTACEWHLFCDWLDKAIAAPTTTFTHWYKVNELHILTAWAHGPEF